MSALQDMVEMQQITDAVHVAPVPSKAMWEMTSALHVPLDLKYQVVRPRPQAQTPAFVEEMLR